MIYSIDADILPVIDSAYTVVRRTVWQVADPKNIFLIVTDGECEIETNGEEYLLKKGDAVFLPENQPYRRTPVNGELCTMMYFHFDARSVRTLSDGEALAETEAARLRAEEAFLRNEKSYLAQTGKIYLRTVNRIGGAETERICAQTEELLKNFSTENALAITLNLCSLLATATGKTLRRLRKNAPPQKMDYAPVNLKNAVLYIKQHLSEKILLDDLCTHCGISKSQLSRYFKAAFGKTPMQYVTELKLSKAKDMLFKSGGISVKAVCDELGFDDQHYFSRLFTKVYGETPSHYRYRVTHFNENKQ